MANQIGVLGPLSLLAGAGRLLVPVRGGRRQGVLAMLALHGDRPVTADALARGVWGDERGGPGSVQPLVSRLRGLGEAVGEPLVITHEAGAYTLHCGPEGTDVRCADILAGRAREAPTADERVALYAEALALWRGAPLAGIEALPFAAAAMAGLEGRHLDLLERWAEAVLEVDAAGATEAVVERLYPQAARHPRRERLQALAMLALYRGGRHVDAIDAYAALRRRLGKLGLDPGPELQALHAGMLRHSPALAGRGSASALPPERHVPRTWTSFVGRDRERAAIEELLGRERLVTLVGMGGAGKTRLATEIAQGIETAASEAVWFVELADLREGVAVARTVASDLGISERPDQQLEVTVAQAIGAQRLLLVLDNCEHLLDAAGRLVHALLRSCPGVRILATSREALHVPGEVTWTVTPLAVPAVDAPQEVQATSPAALLLLDRVAAARPDTPLAAEELAVVGTLCRNLDGIPLALELVAARARGLALNEIAEHLSNLSDRSTMLAAGGTARQAHHQSLQAALDWSRELCSDAERALLPRLAVFAGGATLTAVESICGGEGDVHRSLCALVDKSLVIAVRAAGATRYRMPEIVRQWAAASAEPAQLVEWHDRHAALALRFADDAVGEVCGPAQDRWIAKLEQEHDNVRAALSWCADGGDPVTGLALAAAMWLFWWRHGHISEGDLALRRALRLAPEADPGLRAAGLVGAAYLRWKLGDLTSAGEAAEEALPILERLDVLPGVAAAAGVLGMVARDRGDAAGAERLCQRSFDVARQTGDRWVATCAATMLATLQRDRGEEAAADEALEKTSIEFSALGDEWGVAWTDWLRGRSATRTGRIVAAEARLRRSIILADRLQHRFGVVLGVAGLAGSAAAEGRGERAAVLLGASDALERALGCPVRAIEREDADRDVTAVRGLLAPQRILELRSLGEQLDWASATGFAMSDDDLPPAAPSRPAPMRPRRLG